ncbi:MAG TPA: RidA family protein [Myxococcaceae bacterium]|nr:RidA family protein [Myxococcaceae bacterium]
MEQVQRVYSGAAWEKQAAYCRALRVGHLVFVAGTTAVDETGAVVGRGDVEAQAAFIFQKIGRALGECGSSLKDVVRTRMYVIRRSDFTGAVQAHGRVFEGVDPVATCVQVSALIDSELLIEIEVDAIVRSG